MRTPFSLSRHLLAALLLTAFCLPCWAQQGNLRTVLFVKVKLDQEENWKTTVKGYTAVLRKAGSAQQATIWESQSGPKLYAVVWYSARWKDIGEDDPKLKDSASEMANVIGRLNTETDSLEYWIDEMQPDLGIPSKEIPTMVRTSRTRVIQGKMDELKAMFHDQVVPAIKKSGITSYGFAVARYGTPTNEIHTYMGLSGWGDLDAPFGTEKGMTPAEWKAFQAKLPSLVESTEWTIWKFHPELSYLVPAK